MRVVAYVVAGTLTFLGLLMAGLLPDTLEYAATPLEPISAGILLFLWGVTLYLATRHRYRGGTPSYVGAVLAGLGAWNAIGIATWKYGSEILPNVLASVFLISAGIALLYHGHKVHVDRVS